MMFGKFREEFGHRLLIFPPQKPPIKYMIFLLFRLHHKQEQQQKNIIQMKTLARGNKQKKQAKTRIRKQHHPVLFWTTIISGVLMSMTVIIVLFATDDDLSNYTRNAILVLVFSVITSVVYLVNSYRLADGIGQMCQLFWLLDNSFLVLVLALVALIGLQLLTDEEVHGIQIVGVILHSISTFLYVGTYRVMMYTVIWEKWQIIACKVSLILTALVYIISGTFILFDQAEDIDKIFGSVYAARLKDFIAFYMFGMFSLVLEVYGKVSDQDGTSNLQYYYSFNKPKSEEKGNPIQHPVMFWLTVLSTLVLAILVIIQLFSVSDVESDEQWTRTAIITLILCIATGIIFVVNSCLICESIQQLCHLFWLLDNTFLVILLALVGLVGMNLLTTVVVLPIEMVSLVFNCVSTFLYIGSFRTMMYLLKWQRWQVISTKVILLLNSAIYVISGTIVMFSQLEDDRYNATDLARIKDFIFFYVFAMFTLTLEVFGRISDKDGTSDLKYHYRFGGEEETEKLQTHQ